MSDQSVGAERQGAPLPTPADAAVQRFISAMRTHTLYPANNPNVWTAVGKLREEIARFSTGQPLEVVVKRERLEFDEVPILPDHPEVHELAHRLYLAHIASIVFEPDASVAEIVGFLDILRLTDDERAALGSLEEVLPVRDIRRIQVREAGRLKVEEASGAADEGWGSATMDELEELEKEVLGAGHVGFRESFRTVAEGQDPKSTRLTGLLARPGEFVTILLEIASRHRVDGRVDLDAQLAFTLDLVSQLEPMLDQLVDNDRGRLYRKLEEVVSALLVSIHREIIDVTLPPYVHLGPIRRLFPDTIRLLTVKEALGFGLGAGLMPVLMGGLRRVAAGDRNLPAFLHGVEPPPTPPNIAILSAYRPAALPPAPAEAPQLHPAFFESAPGGAPHPGELALAGTLARANGAFDSIATIIDLMEREHDAESFDGLLDRLVNRFGTCLELHNLEMANVIVGALHMERMRRLAEPTLLAPVVAAIERCGEPETMRAFVALIASIPPGAEEHKKAANLVNGIGRNAMVSLIGLLAAEEAKSTRRKLLDVIVEIGRDQVDLIASYASHPQWYVVRNVVWILGHMGPSMTARIEQVARHQEPRVRKEAVRALGQWRMPEAVNGLLRYLQDPDDGVVREALRRVMASKLPVQQHLEALLLSRNFAERTPELILAVIGALGALGNDVSVKRLLTLASARDAKGWFRSPDVKKALVAAAEAIESRLKAVKGS